MNKLTSIKTQLPYEYYSMPYCRPEKIMPSAENLGEVLRGDRIENSPYEVRSSYQLPPVLDCVSEHAGEGGRYSSNSYSLRIVF